jgi:carboxylate-amine ligase
VADSCASAPTSRVLGTWLTALQPALQELGDDEWVRAEVARLLQDGNGAMRQRLAWQSRGEISDVVAEAAAATVRPA